MINFNAFKTLIDVITGSREREIQEYREFLGFYQELVKIVDDETAKEFGNVKVPTIVRNAVHDGYRLELTVTDYLWWVSIIETDRGRFVYGTATVQRDIWDQLNKLVRDGSLTQEQRSAMLDLKSNVEQ